MDKNKLDLNIQEILENWSISDAIRELIANAYDEAKLSKTQEPKIKYDDIGRQLEIIDFGRGLKPEHFIQNESLEKKESKQTIGKFGIGLKDAIAVLYRHKKEIIISSCFAEFIPIKQYKSGMTDKIETIHIEYDQEKTIPIGTKVVINDISYEDYKRTIDNFLNLNEHKLLSSSIKGEIYSREPEKEASIYYNGMKISTDENFMFSYNILESNTKLNKALNRERKMIARDAYRDNVISILKSCIDKNNQELINYIIENKDLYSNSEWSFLDVKKLVLANTNKKILFITDSAYDSKMPAYETYARSQNFELIHIDVKDYKSIYNDDNLTSKTITHFGNEFISNYEGLKVEPENLNSNEKLNWEWLLGKSKDLALVWNEWKKYCDSTEIVVIDEHPNALGISSSGKIEIVKKILNNKDELFNVLVHEICHTISGTKDCTIDFEKVLTSAFSYVLKTRY